LWGELGVNPARVIPIDPACKAAIAARSAEVQQTHWRFRCAQPPYDTLPIPRADIPAGIILSRDGSACIREDRVEDTALPLWQGVMISGLLTNVARYAGGAGHRARWDRNDLFVEEVDPQFLLGLCFLPKDKPDCLVGFRALARSTDTRTFIDGLINKVPCGNSLGLLAVANNQPDVVYGAAISASFVFDWTLRRRIAGTNINSFFLWEAPWPRRQGASPHLALPTSALVLRGRRHAPLSVAATTDQRLGWRYRWATTWPECMRARVLVDALAASEFGMNISDLAHLLKDCDWPEESLGDPSLEDSFDARGFWRVDKEKDPELRHTVLTLVAFHDLDESVRACGGDRDRGIRAFLTQNNGEGWMLPETLRLADYGLGHDDRAKEHQPVASRLGPRFFDWQLAQTPDESWRECHLHARNLLGAIGYQQLLSEIHKPRTGSSPPLDETGRASARTGSGQMRLFE
jgi:hypothetical protein